MSAGGREALPGGGAAVLRPGLAGIAEALRRAMVDQGDDALEALLANPIAGPPIRLGLRAWRAAGRLAGRRLGPARTAFTVAAAVLPDLAAQIGTRLRAAWARAAAAARSVAGQGDPERLRAAWERVRRDVAPVEEKLGRARALVTIARLEARVDENGELWVDMTPSAGGTLPDPEARLSCRIDYLSGDPGEPGIPLLSTRPEAFPERQKLSLFAGRDFRLNVAATMTISSLRILDPESGRRLRLAVAHLAGRGAGGKTVAAYLERRLAYFERLERDGLEGERVHAAVLEPAQMTIGRSRLGFTTRVGGTQ